MNLIHGVLFVLFAFVGTFSLSAQNFYPNPQAAGVVVAELNALSVPSKAGQATFSQTNTGQPVQSSTVDQNNLTPLKIAVLQLIIVELKNGVPTGDAIENVFGQLPASGARATKLATVKAYIIDLLS